MDRKDFNVILCGKTSTGKTTIADILKNQGYKRNVSYTTRPIREGEENGKDYHFVSPEKFKELKNNDFFVETAAYDASFGHCEYGTAKKSFDTHGVFILNPEGLKTLSKDEVLTKSDNTVVVFLDANEDVLRKRAIKRGDEIKEIDRRLKTDKEDFRTIYATLETYSHYLCFNTGSQMYNSPDKVVEEINRYIDGVILMNYIDNQERQQEPYRENEHFFVNEQSNDIMQQQQRQQQNESLKEERKKINKTLLERAEEGDLIAEEKLESHYHKDIGHIGYRSLDEAIENAKNRCQKEPKISNEKIDKGNELVL